MPLSETPHQRVWREFEALTCAVCNGKKMVAAEWLDIDEGGTQ